MVCYCIRRVISQFRAVCILFKYCINNSYHAAKRALWFKEFVESDLGFFFSFSRSSPGPRRAPTADDSLVRVQRVCGTFPHHTGQSVQTHEPALHSSAAGETPTQRRHRSSHGYSLSANKAEVTLNIFFCLQHSLVSMFCYYSFNWVTNLVCKSVFTFVPDGKWELRI